MISSTARDLPEHRQQVLDACLSQGMLPAMMEHLPARDADAIEASLKMVDDADIYLGVFAFRYGYVPAGYDISITEMEYNRAADRKIPRLIFLMHEDHLIKPGYVETGAGANKLAEFKERLSKERVVNFFKSPEDLRANVINSLSQHRQPESKLSALHSLPPPPADFIGREAELAELRAAMKQGGVHISGLQGQGGVGKTALALKLAHELRRPYYPDAQIFLDLKGVPRQDEKAGERPLTPTEAMTFVIRAWDPNYTQSENGAEVQARYHSALDGKRALLLMDNARDRAQVEPLIPPAGCALLVTSRTHFTLPGLKSKNLETLPPVDAEKLLLEIDRRINGEAANIARLCGYLPLALRLAGSTLAERPDLASSDYAQRLQKERLKVLSESEASIGLSYALLDAETRKRWRTLGVFSDTFDTPAAAAVWQREPDAAQDLISQFRQYSMLEWNETARRYRLHDLMRDFARARLQDAGQEHQVAQRHAAYYLYVLAQADNLYRKGGESIRPGLALFDLEWGNIQAGQAWAAANRDQDEEAARLCNRYPDTGVYCLNLRQHPREHIGWLEAALAAARRLKDRGAEGRHLGNLGTAYKNLGEYRLAIEYHEQHLAIAREISDRLGEGNALGNLGIACANLGDARGAIEYLEQALGIHREIGDRRGEGSTLGNLGVAYRDLGEYHRAVDYHQKHLIIAREIGDRRGEGAALGNLGDAYDSLGDQRRAVEYYDQDLHVARSIGDRRGEGIALWNMSVTLDKLGERQKAIENAEVALKTFEQIESPAAAMVRKRLEEWKKSGDRAIEPSDD